jgi:transcriptional regulator with XRE-family HTH domain
MLIASSSSQPAGLESASTNSIKQQMLEQMRASKEYRHGFIEEAIRSRVVAQITALRKERGWDLKTLAAEIGKKTSWAYRLEDPNAPPPTIPSLLEVAEAFDVGLDVRFRAFSELLHDALAFESGDFTVPSFNEEVSTGAFFRAGRKRSIRQPPCNKPRHRRKPKAKKWSVGRGDIRPLIGSSASPLPEAA